MILDNLSNLRKYEGVISGAEKIAAFLKENDATALTAGRHDLSDGIYVNVLDLNNGENTTYEAHRKYHDLQCIITGDEYMKRCHISAALDGGDYNDEGDYILYSSAEKESVCHLFAGEFAFFEPEDAHCPGICGTTPIVRKLVFKIPV